MINYDIVDIANIMTKNNGNYNDLISVIKGEITYRGKNIHYNDSFCSQVMAFNEIEELKHFKYYLEELLCKN